jgi:cytochrome P450
LIFEVLMARYALLDFTFSDGTFIPAGTVISVHSDHVQLDPQTYEDPLKFDGFRFIKMKERAVLQGYPDKKFDMATTSSEFVAFGQGRHACPGRFFASAEIKLVLAHIVTTYDVKLVDGVRPPDLYVMNGIQPNPTAKLYFRKRQ